MTEEINVVKVMDDRVLKAAMWLADEKEPPALAVPVLKQDFELTSREACEAIRLAQNFRMLRRAFG